MSTHNETLKITADTDNIVEFLYDPIFKEGANNYGAWYLYGVKNDGKEVGIFASQALHGKLKDYRKGDKVNIRKEEYAPGKEGWNITLEEGANVSNGKSTTFSIDDRTHDIHKQVCLKLAVDMMETKNKTLTDGDLVVIEANMKSLLMVLEGSNFLDKEENKDDLPF